MKAYWKITSTIPITLSVLFLFIKNQDNVFAAPPWLHLCRPEQRDALVKLKNELEVFISPFGYNCYVNGTIVTPHPKTVSWEINNDCCTWEGITCNPESGEVIKLDLSCSYLRGQLHSNISLHSLTALDLSSNDFNGQIMSSLGNLSLLTSLDLSYNRFSGEIPSSIGNLSHLTSLDLSDNQLSGQLPSWIGNLSHLTQLDLSSNNFSGQIPSTIGKLSHLTFLVLSSNQFVGQIPSSFGNLNHILSLVLDSNILTGNFPLALLNMTTLSYISLHGNHFTGTLPPNVTSLSKLTFLDAAYNAFTGAIPSSLLTLPSLQFFRLQENQLNGTLDFGNMSLPSFLRELSLGNNKLIGPIPSSISKLTNLQYLDLSKLNSQGPVNFTTFSHLKSLYYLHLSNLNTTTTVDLSYIMSCFKSLYLLDLSGNHVSVTKKSSAAYDLVMQPIQSLLLSGCGITEFPDLLKTKQLLTDLDVSKNKLKGKVPSWLWTLPYLRHVDLSNNNLINFERSPRSGPSLMMAALLVSNNNFTGNIPSFICDLPSLRTLDLSNNNFDGVIPSCMANLRRTLSDLNLGKNRLHGGLPEYIFKYLRSFDVGHNQLTGKLPRALIHSTYLEVLNVGNNVINDTFPFWLSSLPNLKVLVLCSNLFHGPILLQAPFPKLQIIDVSHNHFNGALPSDYFVKWSAMSSLATNEDKLSRKYMGDVYYYDSLVLMNKGVVMELVRILKIYTALDFSSNKLEGKIPRSIGLLKELLVLNLSNNAFTGYIPSSMGNLRALESLDVSQNQLSGEIPQELGSLSYLAYMNFSHNQLEGLVPGGTQFRRQNCSSFEDNKGLFGPSLDEDCRDIHTPASHKQYETTESDEEVLNWIAAVIGAVPGVLLGLTIGYILVSYRPEWFVNPCVRKKHKHRRRSNATH
ncbi:unnamed protein product [Brassica rapa subsp. narinosa]